MSNLVCRLCNRITLSTIITLDRVPSNVQHLLKPQGTYTDSTVDLTIQGCNQCGFVQITPPLLEETYYDDYLMGTLDTAQVYDYRQRLARDFVTQHDLVGKHICEIGCGIGTFLTHLAEAGARVSGIEPSSLARSIAQSRSFNVAEGYIHAGRVVSSGPFDAFVARQVLEHVPDIHSFLQGAYRNLVPGGMGLVEVPSLEKLLLDRRYYDFFPDHVNYFSIPTLRLALEMNGFEVLATWHGMFDEYNIATVVRRELPDLQPVYMNSIALSNDIRSTIEGCRQAGKKVAIWGVGGKGLSVMAQAGIHDADLVVDIDPIKHGLITPVSRLLVSPPIALKDANIDTVIITAMAYRYEIERMLKEELNFTGTVLVLGNGLRPSNTWISGD